MSESQNIKYILRLARHPKGLRKDIIPVLVAELKRRNLDDNAFINKSLTS
jgi:hypothetical protein